MIKKELQGIEQLRQRIGVMISRGENMRHLFVDINEIMYAEVMKNFTAHGRDPAWPDLKESTKKRYAKKGYILEPTLNRHSAGLMHSIQTFVADTSTGLSTNKPYAAIHNFGGDIKIYSRSQKVYFRADETTGEIDNRFARKSRSNFSQWATIGDHMIHIDQREFFKITAAGLSEIEVSAARFIMVT